MNKNISIDNFPAHHSYKEDGQKHPGLIVIHEIWGLNDNIKNIADRFAEQGYSVIAPDLFHDVQFEGKIDQALLDEMHNPQTRDEAQKKMRAIMAPIMAPEFAKDAITKLKKCLDYLLSDEHVNGHIAVVGFCFGGSYSFHLSAKDQRIKAAVPFYGQPPAEDEILNIECPVLAFYGDQDKALMQSLPKLTEDMKKNDKNFEAMVYQNTGHAFFNDTNERMYNADAAKDSWNKVLVFLQENLKN